MLAVTGGGDIIAHAVEHFKLPWPIVDGCDMGGFGVVELVVKAEQETIFPTLFNCLKYWGIPKIISDVPYPIFKAPMCSSDIIGSNGLMQRRSIIRIRFKDDFPPFEMLREWYAHRAQPI